MAQRCNEGLIKGNLRKISVEYWIKGVTLMACADINRASS